MECPADHGRFRALDSLRGIAALIVVLLHCYHAIPEATRKGHPYIDMVLTPGVMLGRFSVILFFVLSGFVLALPYLNGRAPSYSTYFIRRFFRLYPPYAVAVLFAFTACYEFSKSGALVGWPHPPTLQMFFDHLFMTGTGLDSVVLDGPLWTLIVEMRISLVFPLLVVAVKRFGWSSVIAAGLVAFVACQMNDARGAEGAMLARYGNDGVGALLITLRYMALFVLGIVVAANLNFFKGMITRLPIVAHAGLWIGIAAVHLYLVNTGPFDAGLYRVEYGDADVFYGAVAVYCIVATTEYASVARHLSNRLFLWLGDISYSLYLIHLPVLYAVLNILLRTGVRNSLAVGLALPVMFLAAQVMHYAVEMPSMRIGRALAQAKGQLSVQPKGNG